MCICSMNLYCQYEGLDSSRKQVYEKQSFKDSFAETQPLIENSFTGLDLMVSPISSSLFIEANPFVGINIRDHFYFASGLFGSFWSLYNSAQYTAGINATFRIVMNKIFLHTEYRLQYGEVSNYMEPVKYGSYYLPIFGVGYFKDESAYIMVGVAPNQYFANSNPLGKIVYRIGMYF